MKIWIKNLKYFFCSFQPMLLWTLYFTNGFEGIEDIFYIIFTAVMFGTCMLLVVGWHFKELCEGQIEESKLAKELRDDLWAHIHEQEKLIETQHKIIHEFKLLKWKQYGGLSDVQG